MYQELNKAKRIEKFKSAHKTPPNDSYTQNEIKEDLAISFVQLYEHQYADVFPKRPKLILYPLNEYFKHKFVSTFIVPTLLPHDELYYHDKCASFIADHITYEPLKINKLPSVLCSPTTTLEMQKGDCFDISTVLVSFLIGSGYDAYCVYGFAKKHVSLNITKNRCVKVASFLEMEKKSKVEKKEEKKRKYKIPKREVLESKFVKINANKKEEEEEETFEEEYFSEDEDCENDIESNKRVHVWVLLLPGKRQIKEPLFIEPSTGEIHTANDTGYIEIISVWNHENYWVNMQMRRRNKNKAIYFDLTKNEMWESIFFDEKEEKENDKDEKEKEKEENKDKNLSFNLLKKEEDEQDVLDVPLSWCNSLFISREKYLSRFPLKSKTVRYKNCLIMRSAPFFEKNLIVKKIIIYRGGKNRKNNLKKEIHEFFMKRMDKLKKRTLYFDLKGKIYKKVEEFDPGRRYSNTELEGVNKICVEFGKKEIYYFYHEARLDGLCSVTIYLTSQAHSGKPSSSSVPQPGIVSKVTFVYKDREDNLIFRSVKYEIKDSEEDDIVVVSKKGISKGKGKGKGKNKSIKKKKEKGKKITKRTKRKKDLKETKKNSNKQKVGDAITNGAFGVEGDQVVIQKVVKKTEKFALPPNCKDGIHEIAKAEYYPHLLRKIFHFGVGKITRSKMDFYIKTNDFECENITKHAKKPTIEEARAELEKLREMNKKCEEESTSTIKEIDEIKRIRKLEEENIKFETNIYDTLQNQPTIEELEEMKKKELELIAKSKKRDILIGFLPLNGKVENKKQAMRIFKQVLERLKRRVMDRTEIMEGRLKSEKDLMNRKKIQFQKQDMADGVDGKSSSEDFNKFWEKALFKMNILKTRCEMNRIDSKREYKNLQLALLADSRLAPFLKDESQKK